MISDKRIKRLLGQHIRDARNKEKSIILSFIRWYQEEDRAWNLPDLMDPESLYKAYKKKAVLHRAEKRQAAEDLVADAFGRDDD